jgi:hypothetical protein
MSAEMANAKGTEKPTYPRYNVGGCIAIVTFWSNGFNPFPLVTKKSASVGMNGFVTKFVNTKKNI